MNHLNTNKRDQQHAVICLVGFFFFRRWL